MNSIDVRELSNEQMIELMSNSDTFNEELNKEWVRRHGINIPYVLKPNGILMNYITDKEVQEYEYDKEIRKQAEEEKKKRAGVFEKTTLSRLIEKGTESVNDSKIKYLVVWVEGATPKAEIIINPKENIETKLEYYSKAYTEELHLLNNPNIRISEFKFIASLEELFKKEGE